MIYGRQLLHSFLVTSMYTHTYIVSFYQQKDIFVFVGETYAHSNPLLILVNLCEVSSIHFITMMDHHWGGSWGGVSIYIYGVCVCVASCLVFLYLLTLSYSRALSVKLNVS